MRQRYSPQLTQAWKDIYILGKSITLTDLEARAVRQETLFDLGTECESNPDPDPPSNGVPTSNAAAASVKPITGRQRRMMLGYFQRHGVDYTDEELMIYLHDVISPNAIRPRRGELVEAGMIRDSGMTRKTRSGRLAIVWVITEKGMQS